MKTFNDIKTVFFRTDDLHYYIGSRIIEKAEAAGKEVVSYTDEYDLGKLLDSYKKVRESKEVLILKEFPGRKFQKCPGSPNVICCNYYLLNTCFNCLYDCGYCFLNSYLNSYGITQFVNLDDLHKAVIEHASDPERIYRVGTGEFTDSLMMDEITGIAEMLIRHTAPHQNIFLEFKTKSDCVNHLLDIDQKGNTVIAWTLNTASNIRLYEKDTSSIESRINAACNALKSGYLVAFHFDPIIIYKDFMEEYESVLSNLAEKIDPERVTWISLGCFRYSPGFKDIIKHKYPSSIITCEEMFPGIDGKYRYLKSKRIEIYKYFYKRLKSIFPKSYIYFCMESSDVWHSVTGNEFFTSEDLESAMGHSLKKNFLSNAV